MTSLFRPGPLFHVRVHPKQIAAFAFPDDLERRHAIVLGFVDALKRGLLDDKKEVSLHGVFLTRIFGEVLGYRTVTEGGEGGWELVAEQRMGTGGKSVDGALGFFRRGEADRVLVPIELKSVRQDLDRSGGRALTPVQQAWDYANHSPGCRFILVSNYKETRLYSTERPHARPEARSLRGAHPRRVPGRGHQAPAQGRRQAQARRPQVPAGDL